MAYVSDLNLSQFWGLAKTYISGLLLGKADKAATLSGYGITDAKINNGTITLGSDSITPLTASSIDGSDIMLTGYSKPVSSSAIAASDSVNAAIGKLEAADSESVHIASTESVTGAKYFEHGLHALDSGIKKGNITGSHTYTFCNVYDIDKNQLAALILTGGQNSMSVNFAAADIFTSGAASFSGKSIGMTLDSSNNSDVVVGTGNQSFRPGAGNAVTLGKDGFRWKEIFANNATINTSDERLKTSIASFPDDVLDAWESVGFVQYQFVDAVAEKGEGARLHSGLVAQRISEAFAAHGLDASRYGLFCYNSWDALPEERDAEGNIVQTGRQAGDEYSLRYVEALCMEAAYQRRRADRLEARVAALEEKQL